MTRLPVVSCETLMSIYLSSTLIVSTMTGKRIYIYFAQTIMSVMWLLQQTTPPGIIASGENSSRTVFAVINGEVDPLA